MDEKKVEEKAQVKGGPLFFCLIVASVYLLL
jgi:hypothetical protein